MKCANTDFTSYPPKLETMGVVSYCRLTHTGLFC